MGQVARNDREKSTFPLSIFMTYEKNLSKFQHNEAKPPSSLENDLKSNAPLMLVRAFPSTVFLSCFQLSSHQTGTHPSQASPLCWMEQDAGVSEIQALKMLRISWKKR